MSDTHEALLRAILSMTARQVFSVSDLAQIVLKGAGEKQLRAYNMCDGTRTQSEIIQATRLDSGNFSRSVARWIEAGVLFRVGAGRDTKLLHAYPLPVNATRKGKGAA